MEMDLASVGAASTASPTVEKVEDGKPPVKDVKDDKADSSTENLPWHKDERFKEFLKEKKTLESANAKLQKLLKDNDLDDPDDLEDLVKSGKVVRGKISDLNSIDDLIAKSARLDSYETYWAEQKKRQEKESEDPTERADRLERQLDAEKNLHRQEAAMKKQMDDTKRAIKGYESEVQSLIKEVGIPKDHEPFVLELFGVNNPSNDVDITDKKAIKKLVQDGVKRVEAFKQSIIAEYLAEKKGIVKTGQSSESVTGEKTQRMGLKDAHKIAKEQISNMFRGNG
jgi:hypothetical protein